MDQDTSRTYHIWRPDYGYAIIQLGYDEAGRYYFLHVKGYEGLMDKQIGFNVYLDYHDHLGSKIVLQTIDKDNLLDKLKKEADGVIINIIRARNTNNVALYLGRWKAVKWGGKKVGHNIELTTIHFIDIDDNIPSEDEVTKFLDGIKWHK